MNRIEQLERQVAVLREGLLPYAHDRHIGDAAQAALSEANRIAAEPVEETDWEVVMGGVDANSARLEYDAWSFRDGTETCDLEIDPGNGSETFSAGNGCKPAEVVAAAAAWVRAQGEVERG